MKFEQNQNMEELLNSFIDGELSAEESAQVQRLVEKDKVIARRLREIETCRLLVSSLPPAEPPVEVVSGIKELVHGKWAQGVRVDYAQKRSSATLVTGRGHWHLWTRQMLAASVIVGLVGLLGAVVYRIVGPERGTTMIVAVQPEPAITTKAAPAETAKATKAVADATNVGIYSLRLATNDFAAVDAFINKLLEESTWLKYETAKEKAPSTLRYEGQARQSIYRVYCSKGGLEELMTDLSPVWSKFDSATFVMHTEDVGRSVTVEQARPEQITDIAKQDTVDGRIKLAKDFAVMNSIERLIQQEKMLALGGNTYPELTAIPKPVLTSSDKRSTITPKGASDQVQVDLSIVVSGSALSTSLKTGSLTTGSHK